MKWNYVGGGDYIQGLPAQDLDDSELDEGQKILLAQAAGQGLYEKAVAVKTATKEKNDDELKAKN